MNLVTHAMEFIPALMRGRSRRRRRTRLLPLIIGFASMLAFAVEARAQAGAPSAPGQWSITPSVIFGFGGDLDSAGTGFEIGAGYAWGPHYAWEAAFNSLPSIEQGSLLTVDSKIWTFTGNLLYYFNGDRHFSPFVAGGVGVGHGSAEIPANLQGLGLDDSSTNFIVNIGGGLSRELGQRLSVRGDLRYFIGSDLVPDFWRFGIGLGLNVGHR